MDEAEDRQRLRRTCRFLQHLWNIPKGVIKLQSDFVSGLTEEKSRESTLYRMWIKIDKRGMSSL